MKIENAEQVKKILKETKGKFCFHKCTMCGYICGYIMKNDQLCYDSGCDCTSYPYVIELCSDEDLMRYFKMNPKNATEEFVKNHIYYD